MFPKSEPDLTVDLNNCVIDASSRCGLSLAARVTVEPVGHSGACHRFDYGVPEICLSNLNPRILLTANPFTVNSEQQCLYFFFQFRASLIEISCTSHCRLTVCKCKPCQLRKTHLFEQILFRGVMTPTLTPVGPGLYRQMVGLL